MFKKALHWIDNNVIALLAGFLLVFIPLYPKWPLFDILPGYVVRVRLEDFLVAFSLLILLLWIVRRKIKLSFNPVSIGLLVYLVIGALSVLVAIFIVGSVPLQFLHVAKTVLHWLRRIEYFSLFFLGFSAVQSVKRAKTFVFLLFLTLFAVIIYGYGQKYLYWPAFSTMNREYSKGWWLYLSEHARVLSTFGGHYDLAGYLVITLSLCWSFLFGVKRWWSKMLVGLLLAGGFWLLILTASRISFGAYLVGTTVVIFLWTFKKGLGWGVSRWLVAVSLSILIMLSFGDLSDRFLHLLRLDQRVGSLQQILLKPTGQAPKNKAVFLENNLAAVTSKSDMPPTPYKPGQKPEDVNPNQPPLLIPTKTASGATVMVEKPRTYSQNAVLFDLSTGIRLDATWPRAINGFKTDPLLGTGYATLTKTSVDEFTEGESTDNDYLRALGETGLLGFLAFYGTLVTMAVLAFKMLGGVKDTFLYSLTAGFIALIVGLMVNATLIDIFEASKVAYVFWGVSGVVMGTLYASRKKILEDYEPLKIEFSPRDFFLRVKKFLTSDLFIVSLMIVLAVSLRWYKIDGPVADWHSWRQADTSAVTRNYIKNDRINLLYPVYDDLSSIASGLPNPQGLRFVEFPLYNAASVVMRMIFPEFTTESAGRATTIFSSVLCVIFIFLICRKILSRRIAYLSALIYTVLPYSIYYGRVILPDPSMVAMSLGALWFGLKFIEEAKKRYFWLTLIFAAVALLVKPFAIFLMLPLSYFWLANVKGWGIKKSFQWLVIFGVLIGVAALPLLWWRWWISHYPAGVPASDWLYNGDGIRFKGAFWYWLFADRIGRLILGYWGLVLLGIGLIKKNDSKYGYFPLAFFASSFLYLAVFATGNVRHDYYQILIVPSLAILAGVGLDFLLFSSDKWLSKYFAKALGIVSTVFMLAFGWYFIKDYFNINHPEIVEAGTAVDKIAPKKALVIAPYNGDTAFLYQTNRAGWPILEKPVDEMIKMGADYYVSTVIGDTEKQMLTQAETPEYIKAHPLLPRKKYILLVNTDRYIIFQLVPNNKLPKD